MSFVLSKDEMDLVNLTIIKEMAINQQYLIKNAASRMGRDLKIYLHWTAGRYSQFWDDYHIQVDYDGKLYIPKGVEFFTTLPATWQRNTGSVSITALCGYTSNSNSLGSEAITGTQIEGIAKVIAVLASGFNVPIDKKHVLTHGEAADNEDEPIHENYGPKSDCTRWDLEYLGTSESPKFNPWATDGSRGGDVLRGKANWYKNFYPDGVENHFVY